MWHIRQCECGSTEFEKEIDDEVMRCAKCGKLAVFAYTNDEPLLYNVYDKTFADKIYNENK